MQSLSLSFKIPKGKTLYWHDHIGLCSLLKASEYTNLDSYSLVVLQPREKNAYVYDMKIDKVYLLPTDRGDDLIEIPEAQFISQKDAEDLSAKLVLDISKEAFRTPAKPYYVLTDVSLEFIKRMSIREKLPNYSTQDSSDFYTTAANLIQVAEENFRTFEACQNQDDSADSDQTNEAFLKVLESYAKAVVATANAVKRNLEP